MKVERSAVVLLETVSPHVLEGVGTQNWFFSTVGLAFFKICFIERILAELPLIFLLLLVVQIDLVALFNGVAFWGWLSRLPVHGFRTAIICSGWLVVINFVLVLVSRSLKLCLKAYCLILSLRHRIVQVRDLLMVRVVHFWLLDTVHLWRLLFLLRYSTFRVGDAFRFQPWKGVFFLLLRSKFEGIGQLLPLIPCWENSQLILDWDLVAENNSHLTGFDLIWLPVELRSPKRPNLRGEAGRRTLN